MNADRMDRHVQRLMLMAVLCHAYHDWGLVGQIGIVTLCSALAFYAEWLQSREAPGK